MANLQVAFPDGHAQRDQVSFHQFQLRVQMERLPVMNLELTFCPTGFTDRMRLEKSVPDPLPFRRTVLDLLTLS
jgi:hypothetical protein